MTSSGRRLVITAGLFTLLFIVGAAVMFESERFWNGGRPSVADNANLLETIHSVQPHTWHAAAAIPSASLMLLPKADSGFVGSWGGYVQVLSKPNSRRFVAMSKVPMSYYFGEQNGVVFLKTNVYGNPKWPVVKTAVRVLTPKSVEFKLDSICRSCPSPVRQQEITRLTLAGNHELRAHCYTYAYSSGDGQVEIQYKGVLRLLTPGELAAIDKAVENKGKLLTTINSKVAVH